MVFAGIVNIQLIPTSGVLDTIFHKTWIAINILGLPSACTPANNKGCGGYAVTLIGLLIIIVIALTATAVTERLTGARPGGLLAGVLLTLIGSFLFSVYVSLPVDIAIENVRLLAALMGAITVAVFYVLLRNQVKGTKKG